MVVYAEFTLQMMMRSSGWQTSEGEHTHEKRSFYHTRSTLLMA